MEVQVRIPPGLAALHNFIVRADPLDLEEVLAEINEEGGPPDPNRGWPQEESELASGPTSRQEERQAAARREELAQRMWVDYQRIVREREREQL